MKIIKKSIILLVFLVCSISVSFAQNIIADNTPQTLEDLQDSIQKVLIETNTNGASVVLLSGDSVILLKGFGKADVENNINVNENTLFRLGSVSKLFVSLAILKLQEEGRLSLKDKVKDLIPDLKIINPWEEKYPIRIENLLEHTAGLSDWSLAELGCNNPQIKTLKESLEYYPKGRVAKYAPGTRCQYSNLGVSIAAYIVEHVSGMSYEDYIATFFFKPMGIVNMSYSDSEKYKKKGAKGYNNGSRMPFLYPLYRPSAGLIGSSKDLSKLLSFFINRGKVKNTQILSDSSLQRMERGESFNISKSDIFSDLIGLSNYITRYNGFVYHGHGGHVPGSNADLKYLPKYNVGFAIMVNNEDQSVGRKIARFIMAYQTKDLPQNSTKSKISAIGPTTDLSGYYIPTNYKFDAIKFFEKIKTLQKFEYKNDTLYTKTVLNGNSTIRYIQTNNNEYKSVDYKGMGFVQIHDLVEGQVIYSNIGMLKKISPIYAYALLVIFWALFIVPFAIIVFAVISLFIYLFGKRKNKTLLWITLWPLITISFLFVIIFALKMVLSTYMDAFLKLGNMTPLSVLIFIGTIGFALTSLWSIYYIFKNRKVKMSRVFYYHSFLVAIFNLVFTIYFLSNGVIGLMTWT